MSGSSKSSDARKEDLLHRGLRGPEALIDRALALLPSGPAAVESGLGAELARRSGPALYEALLSLVRLSEVLGRRPGGGPLAEALLRLADRAAPRLTEDALADGQARLEDRARAFTRGSRAAPAPRRAAPRSGLTLHLPLRA